MSEAQINKSGVIYLRQNLTTCKRTSLRVNCVSQIPTQGYLKSKFDVNNFKYFVYVTFLNGELQEFPTFVM